MRKFLLALVGVVSLGSVIAAANYQAGQCTSSCSTFLSFVNGSVHTAGMAIVDAANAILGTASNPIRTDPTGTTTQPVSASVTAAAVNCGGSITAGGTAQQLFSAGQYTHGFLLEVGVNDSNTDPIYFSLGNITTTPGAGVSGSFSLNPSTATAAGGSFSSPLNFPVGVAGFINAATTGDKFKCYVW